MLILTIFYKSSYKKLLLTAPAGKFKPISIVFFFNILVSTPIADSFVTYQCISLSLSLSLKTTLFLSLSLSTRRAVLSARVVCPDIDISFLSWCRYFFVVCVVSPDKRERERERERGRSSVLRILSCNLFFFLESDFVCVVSNIGHASLNFNSIKRILLLFVS